LTPLVSCVLLCTYPNRAAYIDEALLSYDLQTYPHRELLVVNDGVPLAAARDDVTILNIDPGRTIGEKRTIGLRVASGAWVATWDDDDFSFPERLETLVELADAQNASAARLSRMWIVDADMRIHCLVDSAAYQTGIVWRADALALGGYPPISYAEDMELSIRLAAAGLGTALCPEPLYAHRRHGANVTAARENLVDNIRRALPHALDAVPAAQARLDFLRAQPRDTLIVPS